MKSSSYNANTDRTMSLRMFTSKPNRFVTCPDLTKYPSQELELHEAFKDYFDNYDQLVTNPNLMLEDKQLCLYYDNVANLFHFVNEFDGKTNEEVRIGMIAMYESKNIQKKLNKRYQTYIESFRYAVNNDYVTWFKVATQEGTKHKSIVYQDKTPFRLHHLTKTLDLFNLSMLFGYKLGAACASMWLSHIYSGCNIVNINNIELPAKLTNEEIQAIMKHAIVAARPDVKALDEEPTEAQIARPDLVLPVDFDLQVELTKIQKQ